MLHPEFTYLEHPDISHDIRYATKLNFTSEIVPGYNSNKPAMTKALAEKLYIIQELVSKDDFNLVIYDAYRPMKAVKHFLKWAEDLDNGNSTKAEFFPHIDKADVFDLGYLSHRSAHARGSTVDLTLIEKGRSLKKTEDVKPEKRILPDGREIHFLDDGSLDMGSHFDLLDRASWNEDSIFSGDYLERRLYLRSLMMDNGFDDYRKEWWHYSLIDEPFPNNSFDFDIK